MPEILDSEDILHALSHSPVREALYVQTIVQNVILLGQMHKHE